MKYTQGKYPIIQKKAIANNTYSFVISCPEVAESANPGQFVHIRANGFTLRRPVSICGIDKEKGLLRIVFEIRGDGTAEIARLNEGELIDMLAPLGHGFTVDTSFKKVILIGGGIGTPPMLPLAQIYGENAAVITGFRNAGAVILNEDFKKTGAETIICTDDGSFGVHGFVTAPLEKILNDGTIDAVYACGPMPMLKISPHYAKRKMSVSVKYRWRNEWLAVSELVSAALAGLKETMRNISLTSARTVLYSKLRR